MKNSNSTVTFIEALVPEEPGMELILGRLAQRRPLVLVGLGVEEAVLEADLVQLLDPVADPGQATRLGLKKVGGKLNLSGEMIYLASRCSYECLTVAVDAFLDSGHPVDIVVLGAIGITRAATCDGLGHRKF
jgi:hypothetical protein